MPSHLYIRLAMTAALCSACSFNFELTSQRTALENQILGTYKELDEDLVMVASVSASEGEAVTTGARAETETAKFQKAKLNRDFNSIDIADLKDEQILGETWDGRLVVLPKGVGLVESASSSQLKLAEIVTYEENRDRQLIWRRTIEESDELAEDDFEEVKRIFVKKLRETAKAGHWFMNQDDIWQQKEAELDEN